MWRVATPESRARFARTAPRLGVAEAGRGSQGHAERRDITVALIDEGSNQDAVEHEATAPADATQLEEDNGAARPPQEGAPAAEAAPPVDEARAGPGDSAQPIPVAATEVLPVVEPVSEAEPVAADPPAADAGAADAGAAQPIASAEDPAPTLVDELPRMLAGIGAGDAGAAGGRTMTADGGPGGGSRLGNVASGARRLSWKVGAAAGAAAVIVIALVVVVANSSHSASSGQAAAHKAQQAEKAKPVSVVSVSPGNGATGVNGTSPITVTYSGPVTSGTRMPTLSPNIAGNWQVSRDTATFTPQVGFTEDTHVTVTIPASAGTTTAAATSFSFTTGRYSILRLDELLSQLGYIPLTWTPTTSSGYIPVDDASAQLAAAYDPPSGSFSFESGYPSLLTNQWSAGSDNEIIDGAVRTFEFDHNLTMDGDAGPRVWAHLLTAIARGERNQHGYTYVWVSQAGAEHLDLWHDGRLAITSPVNTGIAASPTDDGTFPVYLRYTVTQMVGTNPDGSPYDDTVYWVSYFNGGDAVHAFPRASYGWYQSLGCVELPTYGSTAEDVWNLITYGTLVTVTGPVA